MHKLNNFFLLGVVACSLSITGCKSLRYIEIQGPDIYGNSRAETRGDIIQYVLLDNNHKRISLPYGFINNPYNGFYITTTTHSAPHDKYTFLNCYGHEITTPQFDDVFPFEDVGTTALARVKVNNHWGIINSKGEFVVPPSYDKIEDFHNEIAKVWNYKMGYGLINSIGDIIIPPTYLSLRRIPSCDLFVYFKNSPKGAGIIDSKGKIVTQSLYTDIILPKTKTHYVLAYKGGYMMPIGNSGLSPLIHKDGEWVLIDLRGGREISIKERCPAFTGHLTDTNIISENIISLPIYLEDVGIRYIYFNMENGNWNSRHRKNDPNGVYYKTHVFSEGLAAVQDNPHSGYGYINRDGRFIITPRYDEAKGFSEGLAAVQIGSKWGYINSTGETITNFKYDKAEDFHKGFASVCIDGKWGYINEKGEEVLPVEYENVSLFTKDRALIIASSFARLINKNMETIKEWKGAYYDGVGTITFCNDYVIDDYFPTSRIFYHDLDGKIIFSKSR